MINLRVLYSMIDLKVLYLVLLYDWPVSTKNRLQRPKIKSSIGLRAIFSIVTDSSTRDIVLREITSYY